VSGAIGEAERRGGGVKVSGERFGKRALQKVTLDKGGKDGL